MLADGRYKEHEALLWRTRRDRDSGNGCYLDGEPGWWSASSADTQMSHLPSERLRFQDMSSAVTPRPVEIVEYADFACAHCATFTILHGPTDNEPAGGNRDGKACGFVASHSIRVSLLPLNAAACAGEQGKFWPMHESLMFKQADWFNDPRMANLPTHDSLVSPVRT